MKIKQSALAGAVIWTVSLPVLLAVPNSLLNFKIKEFLTGIVFFTISAGPFAFICGAVVGRAIMKWKQNNIPAVKVLNYATLLGACLNVFVGGATLCLMYSYGLLVKHESLGTWLNAFWPFFIHLLPTALLTGAICGMFTASIFSKLPPHST